MDAREKQDKEQKALDAEDIPLILRRGITKIEFMPEGEPNSTGKTGTWEDVDQD